MSLSRPVKFPLLKLPFLCIESVIRNWGIFDIIFFALTSKRTRQIVKHLKIPLKRIGIFLSDQKYIELGDPFRKWHFRNMHEPQSFFDLQYSSKYPLVLQKNAKPLCTSKTDYSLKSYTDRNEITALKMAMEFLNEVFKCSVKTVKIEDNNFPESGDIGVKSASNLFIDQCSSRTVLDYAQSQMLSFLLKNLEVTGTCTFLLRNTEESFFCDPKLIKCKKLIFWPDLAVWVTRDMLLQFEVPQLRFYQCSFSVEDILSFVTSWFHSDNKELEYLYIQYQNRQVSLEEFQTKELNPVPFSERTRDLSESFTGIDFSNGIEIVRHDGLVATIHSKREAFLFYIWHNQ